MKVTKYKHGGKNGDPKKPLPKAKHTITDFSDPLAKAKAKARRMSKLASANAGKKLTAEDKKKMSERLKTSKKYKMGGKVGALKKKLRR